MNHGGGSHHRLEFDVPHGVVGDLLNQKGRPPAQGGLNTVDLQAL